MFNFASASGIPKARHRHSTIHTLPLLAVQNALTPPKGKHLKPPTAAKVQWRRRALASYTTKEDVTTESVSTLLNNGNFVPLEVLYDVNHCFCKSILLRGCPDHCGKFGSINEHGIRSSVF